MTESRGLFPIVTRSIRPLPLASLSSLIEDGKLVAFNVGPDRVAYFVIANKPLDYYAEKPGGIFPKTVPSQAQEYRVLGLNQSQLVLDVMIEGERFNIHDIQPLSGELLLACARSYYRGPDDFEKNGRVYTREGKFAREILLGDGIESVQATTSGVIWSSYFDEGTVGNFGWQRAVGESGLVAWDATGNKLYEFEPRNGMDSICDCYAMNVAAEDDVYFYYYSEFPLVHVRHHEIKSVWKMPISGSDAFAISEGMALFRGGYEDQDTYHLFELGSDGKTELVARVELHDSKGNKLLAERVVGRGNAIYLISDSALYRIDVQTIITAAK